MEERKASKALHLLVVFVGVEVLTAGIKKNETKKGSVT